MVFYIPSFFKFLTKSMPNTVSHVRYMSTKFSKKMSMVRIYTFEKKRVKLKHVQRSFLSASILKVF